MDIFWIIKIGRLVMISTSVKIPRNIMLNVQMKPKNVSTRWVAHIVDAKMVSKKTKKEATHQIVWILMNAKVKDRILRIIIC